MHRISSRLTALAVVALLSPLTGHAADDDQRFAKKAAAGSIAEVELADLALERAKSKKVKALAKHIKKDHQQANATLKSVAEQKGLNLPNETDADHRKEKRRLAKLEGGEFDRAYVEAMIKDHENDIKQFEQQARKGDDQELKQFAAETLPTLKEHLSHAKEVQKHLKSKAKNSP